MDICNVNKITGVSEGVSDDEGAKGCSNVAAVNTNQLFTTTYIPGDIYVPALKALAPKIAADNFQVTYMGAVQKNTLAIMADPNQFKKDRNNNGKAATQATPLPANFANFKVPVPTGNPNAPVRADSLITTRLGAPAVNFAAKN
ncbi:hypothetical protein HDV05_004271 [Chytridiales sp. JEL 0842]|nr:hypothetical protein HDV05_004271 [Chytridiales sp. JEL 0842]